MLWQLIQIARQRCQLNEAWQGSVANFYEFDLKF